MLRLAADENFNSDIVRGVLRQRPDLDIVRIQDVALSGADDRTVLEWAAGQGRVLLTHDVTTLTRYAYDRFSPSRQAIASSSTRTASSTGITGRAWNSKAG